MTTLTPSETAKTRFAPSPTGFMHFGNARTALFNVLYAKHLKGTCLLRIEDTDKLRSEDQYTQAIIQDLEWLGLPWAGNSDGQPVHQSNRDAIYEEYYRKLISQGRAYPCFCTEQELAISRKVQLTRGQPPRYAGTCRHLTKAQQEEKIKKGIKPALRFLVESGKTVQFEDVIRGPQTFLSDDIGDFIIRRGDGSAAFFFCNAIDDALMGVTHALRGEDHLSNTPRQIMILEAVGLGAPQYGHFPTILGQDGAPLSKRNGSRSMKTLREEGYHPKAILNYMARLGHYYADNSLMDVDTLGANFGLSHISHSPAHFDEVQLNFWQKEAMYKSTLPEFVDFICHYASFNDLEIPQKWQDKSAFSRFAAIIQPNVTMPQEALNWARWLLCDTVNDLSEAVQEIIEKTEKNLILAAVNTLQNDPSIDYAAWIKAIQTETGLKGKALYLPIRAIIMRQLSGPELEKVFVLLGPESIRARFEECLEETKPLDRKKSASI
jgi:glutamyl-tRNA synthetase